MHLVQGDCWRCITSRRREQLRAQLRQSHRHALVSGETTACRSTSSSICRAATSACTKPSRSPVRQELGLPSRLATDLTACRER